MRLSKVFNGYPDVEIKNIMMDSREKKPDSIFFCCVGLVNDGHKLASMAVENGAVAIVHCNELEKYYEGVTYVKVEDTRQAMTDFINAFYDYPSHKMDVIGVTGTNGKTTICWVIADLINHFSKCGYIGTIGYISGGELLPTELTTPKNDRMQSILAEMVDNGCKYAAIETSSEGLHAHRIDGIKIGTAIFNNLSRDHLNYHGTYENYFAAKCKLFEMLEDDGVAIINIDDDYGKRLWSMVEKRKVSYSTKQDADYKAENITEFQNHTEFDLVYQGVTRHVVTNMLADYNVYNLLAVIAVMNENGFALDEVIPLLSKINLTPGRCEFIDCGQDFSVIVDYAFTPNSFKNIFNFANKVTPKENKIIALFGAAGDRDHGRREPTTTIADTYCSDIILTDDDVATEKLEDILEDLQQYIHNVKPYVIYDRYQAIKKACQIAGPGDTILLLGKGDEHFLLKAKGREYWMSDAAAARKALAEIKAEKENQI